MDLNQLQVRMSMCDYNYISTQHFNLHCLYDYNYAESTSLPPVKFAKEEIQVKKFILVVVRTEQFTRMCT